MSSDFEYTALISSLPKLEYTEATLRVPISSYLLSQRLRALSPDHYQDLETVKTLLDWTAYPLEQTDKDYLQLCESQLSTLSNTAVKNMMVWRLEFRTIIAALRHKHRDHDIKTLKNWGFGRWVHYIAEHWQDQYLGLSAFFPWVIPLVKSIAQEHPEATERIIAKTLWHWLDEISLGHQFDFEAIVIYQMRWSIVQQRVGDNSTQNSKETFESLLVKALQ